MGDGQLGNIAAATACPLRTFGPPTDKVDSQPGGGVTADMRLSEGSHCLYFHLHR